MRHADPQVLTIPPAIVRVLQCVSPCGLEFWVRSTIWSITCCAMTALRPRPEATLPNLASPSAANRDRHARTVAGVTPTRAAIRSLATPSTASSNTRALSTSRWRAVCDTDSITSTSR